MDEPSPLSIDKVMSDDDDDESEVEAEEIPELVFKLNQEAKLKELLHNINALEIKICSDATKDFIKLLKGDSGGELLRLYAHTSNRFSELMGSWKVRQGKPGMSYIFSLISAILSHPDGMYVPTVKDRMVTSRVIDKFARMIIDEKMDDIYKELNSKEGKRQNAALLLMASIIGRGSVLASEVAKKFDFKLQVFSKLAGYKQRGGDQKRKHLTRKSFVRFAMSFLEVGKPGLLRWILQQKEMYSGVLRGLGNDKDEIVVYVLSTLQNRVLTEDSLVPPGLRSVLFGSVTLEQLVSVSGRENGGPTAELAHSVLVAVCTDPCNGLMPDLKRRPNPLRGNPKRLLGIMKKLKATEINYHRDLLLAIIRGRPFLASSYMDEFPYNLEDFSSPYWFASVSLAANLLSSVGTGLSFDFLHTQPHDPPSIDNPDVQSILSCICPRPFSRSVINKGLLHSDFLVKHGTLRLLLEALTVLDSFISELHRSSSSSNQIMQSWVSLIQEIQNEVRTLLPDPQVLLTLLALQSSQSSACESHLKRKAESGYLLECSSKSRKKLKTRVANEDADIIISGIDVDPQISVPKDNENITETLIADGVDTEKEFMDAISEIWGLDLCSKPVAALNDADIYFHSKLLDALKVYLRMMPTVLEGSFDFFMNLLGDPLALPTNLQCSLLSLLIEYVYWSTRSGIPVRMPPLMYKHLHPFVNLLTFSPISEIKYQAYNLAQAAMLSTGAFDRNIHEIGAWFLFLPGYCGNKWCIEEQGQAVLQSMSRVVVSFLCDAISTIGNNLFKYWAIIEHRAHLNGFKDLSPDFSPLIICVLQKCLRLLSSESGTFSLPEKSMISLYVSNTVKYLLQTQVDAVSLAALIQSILSEGLEDTCSVDDDSGDYLCEWRPLKNLFIFSQAVSRRQACYKFLIDKKAVPIDGSFANTLSEVKKFVSGGNSTEIAGIIKAFTSAVLCTTPDELLKNFPLVMTISQNLLRVPASLLPSIIFLEQSFFASISKLWPEMFVSGLEFAVSIIHHEVSEFDVSPADSLFDKEVPCNIDFDAIESGAGALSFFLKQAPFYVLFPAIMSVGAPYLSESKVQDLLLDKLSDCRSDCLISYLRLVLFWFYQIQSSYKVEPIAELLQLSEICLVLVKNVFTQLLILKPNPGCPTAAGFHVSAENVREVAETVFCHPAVLASLSSPLRCNLELPEGNLGHNLETLLSLSQQSIHKIDHYVLDMLVATFDPLFSSCPDQYSIFEVEGGVCKPPVKALSTLVQRLFLELRDKFDRCIATEDVLPLLPAFYALHVLIRFISPFKLLELVHWMFRQVNVNELSIHKSCNVYALAVGFCIAGGAFESVSNYLHQPVKKRASYNWLWDTDENSFDVNHIEEIYIEVCKLATHFDLDLADLCLLKVVNSIYSQNYMEQQRLHPLNLVMSRVIVRTPIEMISHCVHRTTMTKAKVVFLISKMSPLHMSVFGNLLLGCLNKDSLLTGNQMRTCGYALSDEEFMMLLPAALSYLNSIFFKFDKQYHKNLKNIPSFYSRMLLSGFRNWKSFVSGYIFQEEYDEFFPSSTEELLDLVNGSLLGKAVLMLRYHFSLSGDSVKTKRLLKLFNFIFPCSGTHNELLDCDVNEMKFNSVSQLLNVINSVVAKVSVGRMLLFPEDHQVRFLPTAADGGLKEIFLESGSDEQNSLRMRFMNILVGSWQLMVQKLPSISNDFERNKTADGLSLYKHLEVFILRSTFELASKMRKGLIELQSIPFLEQLIRSALFYRFEDSTTLKMLQSTLTLLLGGKFSRVLHLQLLLAHSQFATIIQSVSRSPNAGTGVFLRPMSSILRLLVIPHSHQTASDGKNDMKTTELCQSQLEIVKLLRTLLQFKPHLCSSDFGKDSDINLRELYLLLLTSYGATLSDIDMEIYNVMHEIELIEKSDNEIAQLDYLWGSAAVKARKEQILEQDKACNITTDAEAAKERQRSQFRENLAIDQKICAMTVLYFPYDRTAGDEPSFSHKLQVDNQRNKCETHSPGLEDLQRYDPVFILRFAIHSLLVGFIEPVEFAGFGLLAVAFVSISSPDLGMRKLGYETLGKFKNALEKCQKKKDVMRLRLLLTYVQNGIEEPWQRVPSVIAIFAAEASLLLLDPSHDHYASLSKLLMHSSRVNMKCIPLFHEFFSSSSVNFRTERLWILRLLYAGLNLDDDGQIYIRNSVLEILLSFYASPLSDIESKELILLIVKKSTKLHKMACYLVEHCGLFSWLSSLLSSFSGMLLGGEKRFLMAQLVVVVEVVNEVISSRNISEWLQRHALEQLMDFSSHLYKLLIGGMKLMRENVPLVNSILWILISTLKISQKRKIYQPHFTLSLESFFQICQAVNVCSTANAELALKVILMSTPPIDIFHVNQGKLSSFLTSAVSIALKSDSGQMYGLRESHLHLRDMSEDAPSEESLTSKLLRWLVASVILGKLSGKLDIASSKLSKRSYKSLNSLFEDFGKGCLGNDKTRFDCEEMLAAPIFYLQQFLGVHCRVLPSVISALSLLLLSDVSEYLVEPGSAVKLGHSTSVASLLSRISCPAEANPSWRWSYYQPWKDLSSELTDMQKIDELHACQTLLVIISNVLGKRSLDSQALSYQDDKISSVFLWERSIIENV